MTFTQLNVQQQQRLEALAVQQGLSPQAMLDHLLSPPALSPTASALSFRAMFEASTAEVLIVDVSAPNEPIVYANPAFERSTGYSKDKIIGLNCRFLQGSDRHQPDIPRLRQAINARQACTALLRNYRKDGSLFYNELRIAPVQEADGSVRYYIGLQNDVTERVLAQQQLQEEQERFRIVSELTSDYAFVMDRQPDGSFSRTWMTEAAFQRMTGFSSDESEARGGWLALTHPDDRALITQRFAEVTQAPRAIRTQYRIITKDGTVRHMLSYARSVADEDGQIVRIYGAARDISAEVAAQQALESARAELEQRVIDRTIALESEMAQREAAQQALAHSEARYRLVTEMMTDYALSMCINLATLQAELEWVTPVFEDITGYPTEHIIDPESITHLVHLEDQDIARAAFEQLVAAPNENSCVVRVRSKGGGYRHLHHTLRSIHSHNAHGQPTVQILAAASDITKRVEAEAALQRERDLMEKTINTSTAAIFLLDCHGRVLFASDHAETLLHAPHDEIIGSGIYDHNLQLDIERVSDEADAAKQQSEEDMIFQRILRDKTAIYNETYRLNRPGQPPVYVAISGAPLLDENGSVREVILTANDITLHKQAEAQLQAAVTRERELNDLKTRFLSMVTHEFKTPLAVIRSSADLMRMKLHLISREQIANRLDILDEQVQHIDALINEVVQINRTQLFTQQARREAVDLPALMTRIVRELRMAYGDRCPIDVTPGPLCDDWTADPAMLQQIISNLLSNAIKYTPDDRPVTVNYQCISNTLTLHVADQGIGIPPEDLDKLFDPFHRASNVGSVSGSGLGLVIVKQAIDAHGGSIHVDSAVGQGTTVTITLPSTHS